MNWIEPALTVHWAEKTIRIHTLRQWARISIVLLLRAAVVTKSSWVWSLLICCYSWNVSNILILCYRHSNLRSNLHVEGCEQERSRCICRWTGWTWAIYIERGIVRLQWGGISYDWLSCKWFCNSNFSHKMFFFFTFRFVLFWAKASGPLNTWTKMLRSMHTGGNNGYRSMIRKLFIKR